MSGHVQAQAADSYDAIVARGRTELQAGHDEAALNEGRRAVALDRTRWEAHALAGGALLNLKRFEDAADEFGAAIAQAPSDKQAALRTLRRDAIAAEGGAPSPPASAKGAATQAEVVLWKSIENSADLGDFQAYLQQYPEGTFARMAQARVARLRDAKGLDLVGTIWSIKLVSSNQYRFVAFTGEGAIRLGLCAVECQGALAHADFDSLTAKYFSDPDPLNRGTWSVAGPTLKFSTQKTFQSCVAILEWEVTRGPGDMQGAWSTRTENCRGDNLPHDAIVMHRIYPPQAASPAG